MKTSCYLDSNEKESCCGCKVCSAVCPVNAISFSFDEEGFWYPNIDEEKCIHCNKCRNVCPLNSENLPTIKEENKTFASYAKSDDVLRKSASGGIFSVLSDVILENKGIVFGHIYDENCRAVCSKAETKSERDKMCGSKYVQSDMKNIYSEINKATKEKNCVLVSGTPCQIDAIKSYFGKRIPKNLYTMGIICHGVPSPKIFDEYIKLQEIKTNKKIEEVVFREKSRGWTLPTRIFCYSDGSTQKELLKNDSFNYLFQLNCILRPSCYKCRYAGRKRIEDISIGDFWGVQKENAEMFNDNKGVSLVLLNTEKGFNLFNSVKDSVVFKRIPFSVAQKRNLPLQHSSNPYCERSYFYKDYHKKGLSWCLKFYISKSFIGRAYRKVRREVHKFFKKNSRS